MQSKGRVVARRQAPTDLGVLLDRRLPAATRRLMGKVVRLAQEQGMPIYLVGGCVRDLLLGRSNLDLDLVVEGNALPLGRALAKRFGGRLVVHKSFGTAVWWPADDHPGILRAPGISKQKSRGMPEFLDLITARRETYAHPAALPEVQFAGIRDDQVRRDFTINTLAFRLDGNDAGKMLDPFGGFQDLRAGLLRTLHPLSFSDDPTRILRISRLAGRLGFKIEKETKAQLAVYLPELQKVSGDRVRKELELVLAEKERVSILQMMQKQGVLRTIHPTLKISHLAAQRLNAVAGKSFATYWNLEPLIASDLGFVLWLMEGTASAIKEMVHRLSFRADLREAILAAGHLLTLRKRLLKQRPSEIVAELERIPNLAIYAVYLANRGSSFARCLQLYVRKWRYLYPQTDGNLLKRLGVKTGPVYKQILGRLRSAWLDGEIRTSKQEQVLLKRLLDEHR